MKTLLIYLLLILWGVFSYAQKNKQSLKIEDTKTFCSNYIGLKTLPPRGEFETTKEYQKRLPNPIDTSKVIYFKFSLNADDIHYNYDLDKQTLTFEGGRIYDNSPREYNSQDGILVTIKENIENKDSYFAQNSYGATVTVEKKYYFSYVFNFLNIKTLPDSIFTPHYNPAIGQAFFDNFHLSIKKSPKEAEKLSKTAFLVVGVKMISPAQSSFECTKQYKPTIDNPIESALFTTWIDVNFVSLLVYDKSSKKILIQYNKN